MNSAVLNKLVRDQMAFEMEYSFPLMEVIYNDIMNLERFIEYKKVSRKTLHNQLSEWANVEGGWLGKKGKGKDARFYKVEPPLVVISWDGLIRRYEGVLKCVRLRVLRHIKTGKAVKG